MIDANETHKCGHRSLRISRAFRTLSGPPSSRPAPLPSASGPLFSVSGLPGFFSEFILGSPFFGSLHPVSCPCLPNHYPLPNSHQSTSALADGRNRTVAPVVIIYTYCPAWTRHRDVPGGTKDVQSVDMPGQNAINPAERPASKYSYR